MAKKFGKFLMATATIGAIAAGAYYLFQKKDSLADDDFDEDEDFDDFDEESEDEEDDSERKYVDLDLANTPASDAEGDFREGLEAVKAEATDKVVGAAGSVAKAADKAETKVEEFFDDDNNDDSSLDAM